MSRDTDFGREIQNLEGNSGSGFSSSDHGDDCESKGTQRQIRQDEYRRRKRSNENLIEI